MLSKPGMRAKKPGIQAGHPLRRKAGKEPVGQTRALVGGQKVGGGLEHLKVNNFCSIPYR